jgi:hypothetical protein
MREALERALDRLRGIARDDDGMEVGEAHRVSGTRGLRSEWAALKHVRRYAVTRERAKRAPLRRTTVVYACVVSTSASEPISIRRRRNAVAAGERRMIARRELRA